MKKNFFCLLFLSGLTNILFAQTQSVAINNSGALPNASAMLDVQSSTKGILIPRMTQAQRVAISTPATGLLVYQTDGTAGFYFNTGVPVFPNWTALPHSQTVWRTTGNAGINPLNNFIGTTDNNPLQLRVNNLHAGQIHPESGNVFFGLKAGPNNTTGYSNLALGNGALFVNTIRNNLVAIGDSALYNNGIGVLFNYQSAGNTAIGSKALFANTTGYLNTANGFRALYSNTSGNENTANGYQALYSNSTGYENTANGVQALYTNTTGFWNIAIGHQSLYFNTSGSENTANGFRALEDNTTGTNNTASGLFSMRNNTTGSDNTAIGSIALYNNSSGYGNVAIGCRALYNSINGSNIVAIGDSALYNQGTNSGNNYRNTAVGSKALFANTTGYWNTANGSQTLYSNTTGYNNTGLGNNADVSISSLNNATVIGAEALVGASKTMAFGRKDSVFHWVFGRSAISHSSYALQVGNTATDGNGAYLTKTGNWTNPSSRFLKEDFADLNPIRLVEQIKQLPIQRWKYKGSNEYHIGPVSQDFYRIFGVGADDKGISTIDPAGIALAAIQVQQKQIEEQQNQIDILVKENEIFRQMLTDMKKDMQLIKERLK